MQPRLTCALAETAEGAANHKGSTLLDHEERLLLLVHLRRKLLNGSELEALRLAMLHAGGNLARAATHRARVALLGREENCQFSSSSGPIAHGPIFTTLTPVSPTGRPCSIWHAISQLWQPEHH